MMPFTEACCELLGIYLTGRWANRVSKRGRGLTRRRRPLVSLVRRQAGDLVRLEHRVPGGTVGRDRDPERLAVLDDLALGNDAGVRDPGYVALGGLGEPHRAVGRGRDVLRAGVVGQRELADFVRVRVELADPLGDEARAEPDVPVGGDSDPPRDEGVGLRERRVAGRRVEPADRLVRGRGEPDDPGLVDGHVARLGDGELGEAGVRAGGVVAPEAVVIEVRVPDVVAVGGDAAAVGKRVVRSHERQDLSASRDAPQARVVGGEVQDVTGPLHDVVEQAEALGGPYAVLYAELGDLARRGDPADVAVEGAALVWVGAGGEDFVALGEPEVAVGADGDVARLAVVRGDPELLERSER